MQAEEDEASPRTSQRQRSASLPPRPDAESAAPSSASVPPAGGAAGVALDDDAAAPRLTQIAAYGSRIKNLLVRTFSHDDLSSSGEGEGSSGYDVSVSYDVSASDRNDASGMSGVSASDGNDASALDASGIESAEGGGRRQAKKEHRLSTDDVLGTVGDETLTPPKTRPEDLRVGHDDDGDDVAPETPRALPQEVEPEDGKEGKEGEKKKRLDPPSASWSVVSGRDDPWIYSPDTLEEEKESEGAAVATAGGRPRKFGSPEPTAASLSLASAMDEAANDDDVRGHIGEVDASNEEEKRDVVEEGADVEQGGGIASLGAAPRPDLRAGGETRTWLPSTPRPTDPLAAARSPGPVDLDDSIEESTVVHGNNVAEPPASAPLFSKQPTSDGDRALATPEKSAKKDASFRSPTLLDFIRSPRDAFLTTSPQRTSRSRRYRSNDYVDVEANDHGHDAGRFATPATPVTPGAINHCSSNVAAAPLNTSGDRNLSYDASSANDDGSRSFFARPRTAKYLFVTSLFLVVCSLGLAAAGLGLMYTAKSAQRAKEHVEQGPVVTGLQWIEDGPVRTGLEPADLADSAPVPPPLEQHDADAGGLAISVDGVDDEGGTGPKGQLGDDAGPKARLTDGPTESPIDFSDVVPEITLDFTTTEATEADLLTFPKATGANVAAIMEGAEDYEGEGETGDLDFDWIELDGGFSTEAPDAEAVATSATAAATATTAVATTPAPPACPATLADSHAIDARSTLHYALVPSNPPGAKNGLFCARLEVSDHDGWVALGFSADDEGSMRGSDAVVGTPWDGTVQKYDLGRGRAEVMPEGKQTLTDASVVQLNGNTVLEFSKLLMEEGEVSIWEDESVFLYARGEDGGGSFGRHAERSSFELSFESAAIADSAPAATATADETASPMGGEESDGIATTVPTELVATTTTNDVAEDLVSEVVTSTPDMTMVVADETQFLLDGDDADDVVSGSIASLSLTPVEDTWLEVGDAGPKGLNLGLRVDGAPERATLIKFDLSALSDAGVDGEDVVGMTLKLYSLTNAAYGGLVEKLGDACSDEWDELEVAWTDAPDCVFVNGSEVEDAGEIEGPVEAQTWTEAVLDFDPTPAPVEGLMTLRITSDRNQGVTYASRHRETGSPELVVYYLAPSAAIETVTSKPTWSPTSARPTGSPELKGPSAEPTGSPERKPTPAPSLEPTLPWPTYSPTIGPTMNGTFPPSASPTITPPDLVIPVAQDAMIHDGQFRNFRFGKDPFIALQGNRRKGVLEFDVSDTKPGFEYMYSLKLFVTYVGRSTSRPVLVSVVTTPGFAWDESTVSWNSFGEPETEAIGWFNVYNDDSETQVEVPIGDIPNNGTIILVLENLVDADANGIVNPQSGGGMEDKFDFRTREYASAFGVDAASANPPTLVAVPQLD
ncbi:hypothetical protein ACHAWF_016315 [Thalassiosira exigua]